MNLTNYHSHCLYCDGRADMDAFIRFAIAEGFTSYGISSHAPLPFPTAWTMEWDQMEDYLAEFRRVKEKYAGKIEFYSGLEIDYLNEESNPSIARFRELPLDYRIGSVHRITVRRQCASVLGCFTECLLQNGGGLGGLRRHYIGLGQGPIFAGQAVLACTDGHVPVAGKRLAYGQREQSVHRCSAGGLFLSGGAVGRAERRHIRHLGN